MAPPFRDWMVRGTVINYSGLVAADGFHTRLMTIFHLKIFSYASATLPPSLPACPGHT